MPKFKVGDIVMVIEHPGIWGKVTGMLDNSIHYTVKSTVFRPTLLCEEHEIELAVLETLADV
jgi:hypothetical protein